MRVLIQVGTIDSDQYHEQFIVQPLVLTYNPRQFLLGGLEKKPSIAIFIKDGAYFCYCAYVLRISRYSGLNK